MPSRLLTTAVTLFTALGAQTYPRSPGAASSPDEIAQAVRDLGSADYRVRERATAWLWAAGPAVEDALTAGLQSPDAEVVARCRALLDKIPYGITPDMPPRFAELIATARAGGPNGWPAVAPELLDLGPQGLEVARKLVDRLGQTGLQRAAMLRTLDQQGWRLAPALLAAGRIDRAGEVLERSAVTAAIAAADGPGLRAANAWPPPEFAGARHYAAFLATRGRLAEQLPRWRTAGDVGEPTRSVILTHLARLSGDLAEARRAVEQTRRADLKEAVLFDQGAWAELTGLQVIEPQYAPMRDAINEGLKAMYLTAAGKPTDADAAFDRLKKLPHSYSTIISPPMAVRALLFAGRPAEALARLAQNHDDQENCAWPQFELLCQLHRYDEAFPKLDRPAVERSDIRWLWDTAKLRVYRRLGEREDFQKALSPLTGHLTIPQPEWSAALGMVELLVSFDELTAARSIAVAVLNGGAAPADVFAKLHPKAPLAAEAWWRYLRLEHPEAAMRDIVDRLPALLDKRLAEPAGQATLEAAVKVARTQSDPDRWLRGLSEACQAAGLDEQARAYSNEAAERSTGPAAWLKLGDLHAGAKQYAEAAAAYERAWRADAKQAAPLWLRGWALEKGGQPGGPEARELAHTLPLADEAARMKLAMELSGRSSFGPELKAATRDELRLILRLGSPASATAREAQRLLCFDSGAYPDFLAAADADQRLALRQLRTATYYLRIPGYLVAVQRRAIHRARGLLAAGDAAGAVRETEAAAAMLPGSDEPAVFVVPELAKRGHAAEADRLYAAPARVLDKLCKNYPQSAEFLNNRAWLAARCRRDLDRAVELARKAVELEPKRASWRDTLAEALFQRGDKAAAVAEIKRCVELEPADAYFAKQRARMEAGDKDAPVPER
jgi:tetratricopeptide (TPR) repeat protein